MSERKSSFQNGKTEFFENDIVISISISAISVNVQCDL